MYPDSFVVIPLFFNTLGFKNWGGGRDFKLFSVVLAEWGGGGGTAE